MLTFPNPNSDTINTDITNTAPDDNDYQTVEYSTQQVNEESNDDDDKSDWNNNRNGNKFSRRNQRKKNERQRKQQNQGPFGLWGFRG